MLKKIINIIISIIKHIILFITSLFVKTLKDRKKSRIDEKKNNNKNEEKKETLLNSNTATGIPEEPDELTLSNTLNKENNQNKMDIVKNLENIKQNEKEIDKYYSIIMKAIDEYFEKKYKVKIKKFTKEEKKNYNKFVERLYPYVRKELIRYRSYDDDKLESIIESELKYVSKAEEDLKEKVYFLATPKPKEKVNSKKTQQTKDKPIKKDEQKENAEKIKRNSNEQSIVMVSTTEIKEPTLKDEIPNIALGATLTTTNLIKETFSPTIEVTRTEPKKENLNITEKESITKIDDTKEVKKESDINQPQPEQPKTQIINEVNKELQSLEEKLTIEEKELNQIEDKLDKNQNEEKKDNINLIEQTIQEEQKETLKEEEKQREEEINKLGFYEEFELRRIDTNSKKAINNSKEEMQKEDFEEKDYDGMISKIENMLNEIEMTYIKYEGKLTEEQLASLKKEEEKLRNSKEAIQNQKNTDYENEHKSLEEPILQSELDGLQNHLNNLEKENEAEVSESFLKKMDKLEELTREQVAKVDKRILMNRFRKASIALEIGSLLALPFIRNKFFLQFTAGLIVDNHFNFINGVFNRKLKKQDPVDLDNIKKGQDALNGALDITYKNMIELDYLEQKAISRYPELSNDASFINQTEKLRNKLNKKYNKLMKKNELMEKHYGKTKRQTKILKFKKKKENEEAA